MPERLTMAMPMDADVVFIDTGLKAGVFWEDGGVGVVERV